MKDIKILVRFDDICPTMDFVQFEKALKILHSKNIKPLLGVIPDCIDSDLAIEEAHDEFWLWVKSLQSDGYTIAMHGYRHVLENTGRGVVTRRFDSEFAGLPLEDQIQKIKEGKNILKKHGIETDIFFAPAHSYDENTLIALKKCGFKYMSDGKSSWPYMWHGIKCLPARSAGCPTITRDGMYTAVFHAHEWVRKDKVSDYTSFVSLISKHSDYIVSFESFCSTPCGNYYVERLKEKLYVFVERNCLSLAVKIKHLLNL